MANLTKAGVVVLAEWTEGGTNGRLLSSRKLQLSLNSMGSLVNKIPADVLGFRKIHDSTPAVNAAGTFLYQTSPSYDGSQILVKAEATSAPADVTGTFRLTVRGD